MNLDAAGVRRLQPQLARTILPEQTPIPDVAPNHLHAPVSSLLHDRPFRRSCNSRTRSMTGPQRMAREFRRVKSRARRQFLYHPRHV